MRDPVVIALREIDVDIAVRRDELALLERCREVLVRAKNTKTCDLTPTCDGTIWSRWCRACGAVIRRCRAHGGLEAATSAFTAHSIEHGGAVLPRPQKPINRKESR